MDELTQARAFQLEIAERLYLAACVLGQRAEKRKMQTTVKHGPEFFRFESFEHWHDNGGAFSQADNARFTRAIYVDARGRICTRSSHYLRARDEGTFPVVVYAIDGE